MPRWYGLRFALIVMWVIVIANGVDNVVMRPEQLWLGQFRSVGIAAALTLFLREGRRWAWWGCLVWFAVGAALFAAFSTSSESISSPWLGAGLAALAIVGFMAVLNGRDELVGAGLASPED
jgi:hypothetical protein